MAKNKEATSFAVVAAQEALKDAGVLVITEDSLHQAGGKTFYRVVGKEADGEDQAEFEALGDDRLSALKALLVTAKSK